MSTPVIARRYRPQGFDAVVGQNPVVRALRGALARGSGAAFLFSGTRGVGKTTCARILAKCFNCRKLDKPGPEPCGECVACVEIAESRALDVIEIDAASHTQVEKTRELLAGTVYAPARDRFKIIILDEVHMLSTSSFNALLKTLEEPPAHLVFILATTETDKVPVTIRSRCLHFIFRPVGMADMMAHLGKIITAEGAAASPASLERIARAAHGSLRDSQSLLEQVLALGAGRVIDADVEELTGGRRIELARDYLAKLPGGDAVALLDVIDAVLAQSESPEAFAGELLLAARDLLVAGARGQAITPALQGSADFLTGERGSLLLDLLMEQESRARRSGQARAVLESYAFRLARLKDLLPLEALMQSAGSGGGAPPATAAVRGGAGAAGGSPPATRRSDAATAMSAPVMTSAKMPEPANPVVTTGAEPIPPLPKAEPHAAADAVCFLDALFALDAMAQGYVEPARFRREGKSIFLDFPGTRRRSKERMEKPEHHALLLRAARQVWPEIEGVTLTLAGDPAASANAPRTQATAAIPAASAPALSARASSIEHQTSTAPASARSPGEMRNHPEVRKVMEFFNAELLTVKPPRAAAATETAADE